MATTLAIVDDHRLVAEAFANLIEKFEEYEVILVAENGYDLFEQIKRKQVIPDLVLVDVNMPVMNGFETAAQLRLLYPDIRVLALSMNDREEYIVRMVRNGARGYVLKGIRSHELRQALDDVLTKGYYYTDYLTKQLINNLNGTSQKGPAGIFNLNDREYEFLRLACSELTYNEIADKMCVSPRTVDGYREFVFQKMNVKNRVGMVLVAVRQGLIDV